MNPPEWPGQNPPPGQPGFPPQGPPYGHPGGGFPPPPGPPPPPRGGGGSGALIPLLIIGAVLVLVVLGAGVFVILSSGDDDPPNPPIANTTTPTTTIPTPTATDTATRPTTADMNTILTSTIEPTPGKTYTRAGSIRTANCDDRADSDLAPAIKAYPCVDQMSSALYTDSSKQVVTVLSILKFSTSSDADKVSDETSEGANPTLLLPPPGSGLKAGDSTPPAWTRSWTQGEYVVYAQGYNLSGAHPGGRDGTVYKNAGELGTEIRSRLIWSN